MGLALSMSAGEEKWPECLLQHLPSCGTCHLLIFHCLKAICWPRPTRIGWENVLLLGETIGLLAPFICHYVANITKLHDVKQCVISPGSVGSLGSGEHFLLGSSKSYSQIAKDTPVSWAGCVRWPLRSCALFLQQHSLEHLPGSSQLLGQEGKLAVLEAGPGTGPSSLPLCFLGQTVADQPRSTPWKKQWIVANVRTSYHIPLKGEHANNWEQ